jgi:hypothetical protein
MSERPQLTCRCRFGLPVLWHVTFDNFNCLVHEGVFAVSGIVGKLEASQLTAFKWCRQAGAPRALSFGHETNDDGEENPCWQEKAGMTAVG